MTGTALGGSLILKLHLFHRKTCLRDAEGGSIASRIVYHRKPIALSCLKIAPLTLKMIL